MAQQAFYVGLDLTGNPIKYVRDAVDPQDAPTLSQVQGLISGVVSAVHPAATAGVGIVANLDQYNQVVSINQAWLGNVIEGALASKVIGLHPINVDSTSVPGSIYISLDQALVDQAHPAAVAGPGITVDAAQTVSVKTTTGGGIVADSNGVYVDAGAGISRTVDGVAVNAGDGLKINNADFLTVKPKPGGGLTVDSSGVAIDPAVQVNAHLPATSGFGIMPIDATQVIHVNVAGIAADPVFKTHDPVTSTDTSILVGGISGQDLSVNPPAIAAHPSLKVHSPVTAADTSILVGGASGQAIQVNIGELVKNPEMKSHNPAVAGAYVLPITESQVVGVDIAGLATAPGLNIHNPAVAGLGILPIDATQRVAVDPVALATIPGLKVHDPVTSVDGSVRIVGQDLSVDLSGAGGGSSHDPVTSTDGSINVAGQDLAVNISDIATAPALKVHDPVTSTDGSIMVTGQDLSVNLTDVIDSVHDPVTSTDGSITVTGQDLSVNASDIATDPALKVHNPAVAGDGIVPIGSDQTVSVLTTPGGGIRADFSGVYVDVGAGLSNSATGVSVNLGDGLTFGGVNTDYATVLAEPGGGITVSPTGISVNPADLIADPAFELHSPVTAADSSIIVGSDQELSVNPAWMATAAPVTSIVGTNGVAASAPAAGVVTVSAVVDPAAGNQLTASAAGLLVPAQPPIDFPVDEVTQGAGVVVSYSKDANGKDKYGVSAHVSLDATPQANILRIGADQGLYVPATDLSEYPTDVDLGAAIDVINDRIDGITIIGNGLAVVTEATPDNFVVNVPAFTLKTTYVGEGTDSATIEADLTTRVPPVVSEIGDMYINTTTGKAFICTDPGVAWTELSTSVSGIVEIAAADNSVTIGNSTGPTATVAVSSALQAQITTATTINTAQDAAILALQTNSHVPAAGSAAIKVSSGQSVSLLIDPLSTPEVLSQTDSGLLIDLSDYALASGSHVAAVGTPGEVLVGPVTQIVSLDPLFVDRVEALEGVDHAAAVSGSGAIVVDPVTQAVSLLADPASPAPITQTAAGLSVDLGSVGSSSHVPAVGTAGEITVVPATQVIGLDAALVTEIHNATATNTTQNTNIAALQTNSHVPAVGTVGQITVDLTTQAVALDDAFTDRIDAIEGDITTIEGSISTIQADVHEAAVSGSGAITVDPTTQAVSLLTDPTSQATLTQSVAGLKVDLGAVGSSSHVPAVGTAGEIDVVANTQAVSLSQTIKDRLTTIEGDITAIEGVNGSQDTAIAGLVANAHVPAVQVANNAVTVEAATQAVQLVIDPASTSVLTQSAAGLALNQAALVPPAPVALTFSAVSGGYEATANGPVGGVAVVRVNGCVATFNVCEAAGLYTISSNVDPGLGVATLHFG